MQTYQIDTPDGASYKVEAENDQQAQSAINSYLPSQSSEFDAGKTASNILPDAGQMAFGLADTIKHGLYDVPKGIIQAPQTIVRTGEELANGVPLSQTTFSERKPDFAKNPIETAQAMAQPVTHPVDFFQNHPVQQTLNVLSLLTGLHGAAKSALADSAVGQRMAARTTAGALDMNPLAVKKMAMQAGVSPEEFVLDLGNKTDKAVPGLVTPGASANSKFASVLEAHDTAGKQIGEISKSLTKETGKNSVDFPEAQQTIDSLRDAAKNYYQVDGGDAALLKTADRLEALQKEGKLDFDRLSKVKSEIGKGFLKKETPAGTEDIYDILNQNAQKVVDRLSVQDPQLAPKLQALKETYTTTSRLLPTMIRTAAKEVAGANVGGGVLSKAIPSAIGGALGGPLGALAGAGAKYAQEIIAPDLTKNLAYMAMKSGGLPSAPGLPTAAMTNNVAQASQRQPISELIKQLRAKFDARRKM